MAMILGQTRLALMVDLAPLPGMSVATTLSASAYVMLSSSYAYSDTSMRLRQCTSPPDSGGAVWCTILVVVI